MRDENAQVAPLSATCSNSALPRERSHFPRLSRGAAAQAAEAEQSNLAAPLKQIDSLFEWWEATLWRVGFFGAGRGVHSAYGESEGLQQEKSRAAAAMAKLRRAIMRAQPSVSEAALLRGALQTMAKPKECSGSDGDEEKARSEDTE